MLRAGLVSLDVGDRWIGGRYYLHHLVRCVAEAAPECLELKEVVWGDAPERDPFKEVRGLLGDAVVIRAPSDPLRRAVRKIKRLVRGIGDARDLFSAQDIDVLFPIPLCENGGVPYVFWLPDFQYLRRPDLLAPTARDRMESYYREHVAASSQIVLSSEDARRDFAAVFPERLADTHVVRFCSIPDEQWWAREPDHVVRDLNLPSRFFIACNQFTRHKNHLILVRALKQLRDGGVPDVHLVFTGSLFDHRGEDYVDEVRRYAEQHELSQQVHILGLIPRAEQIALIRAAHAVLQPSLFEGWSTIIEDAKTLGKQVLASDLPVHVEQLPGQRLIAAEDPAAWAEAIALSFSGTETAPNGHSQFAESMKTAKQACATAFLNALIAGAADK